MMPTILALNIFLLGKPLGYSSRRIPSVAYPKTPLFSVYSVRRDWTQPDFLANGVHVLLEKFKTWTAKFVAKTLSALSFLVTNVWIIFFVVLVLVPAFQRAILASSRKSILARLAQKLNSQVITLIHRQEVVSFLGIPIARYIDIDDSEDVLRAVRMAPRDAPVTIIMHTPGGIALAASQIAFALASHKGKKTVIVPHFAMSGGTLIALAADEIVMDPYAVLGPVDPQFVEGNQSYPAVSILKVAQFKKPENMDDRTLILYDQANKAVEQTEAIVRKIMSSSYEERVIQNVIQELVRGRYTHDYPVTAEEAKRIGLRVSENVPLEVYQLMALYRMESRGRRPGVEYVPVIPSAQGGDSRSSAQVS
jgi:ClpP class serine protease